MPVPDVHLISADLFNHARTLEQIDLHLQEYEGWSVAQPRPKTHAAGPFHVVLRRHSDGARFTAQFLPCVDNTWRLDNQLTPTPE